ncbi:MAG: hypothetical protein R3D67_17750 [Hyphomicrobiaceae bacterium]
MDEIYGRGLLLAPHHCGTNKVLPQTVSAPRDQRPIAEWATRVVRDADVAEIDSERARPAAAAFGFVQN